MLNGKPGPVFLEMPMDVLNNLADTDTLFDPGEPEHYRYEGRTAPDPAYAVEAAALLEKAQRPVIMAGESVCWGGRTSRRREPAGGGKGRGVLPAGARGCLAPPHPTVFSWLRAPAVAGGAR